MINSGGFTREYHSNLKLPIFNNTTSAAEGGQLIQRHRDIAILTNSPSRKKNIATIAFKAG